MQQKENQYENKHRIKQGLSLLLAGGIALTNLGAALPAFAEDAPATPETASAVTPETAEADTTAPNLVQITENLYNDLPDAPTGSYLGSMGLPVATGETKIGISAWVSDLYDGVDAFEITKALDGQTIWLGNADYNADITTANSGGTLIDTGEGIVTITFGSRNADKTYSTDPTGIANNEDSYTMHANADKMQNDRVLGNILLTKVDLDAARYLASGSNGDTTLEGAVYDLYAADTIEHPDGVSGVVDYSKITDASGAPIWHTTVLTNGGWDTDYLPILQKDRLVASAKITDGKLAFANLYMGRYYLVERATGLVLPIDGNGKLYVTGKYPQLNKKLERTGKYSNLARKNNEYTDYIYKISILLWLRAASWTAARRGMATICLMPRATSAMRSTTTKP